jgi:hypothetical protein
MRSSPPPIERFYAVDRLENAVAVLVDDQGRTASVPLDRLPAGTAAGIVLRVPLDASVPNWSRAFIDRDETARRGEGG